MEHKEKIDPPKVMRRRVFVSMVDDSVLEKNQCELKWAIVKKIEDSGFDVEIFYNPKSTQGRAACLSP